MDWQTIGVLATALIGFAALNFGALQWLLTRHDSLREENAAKIAQLEGKFQRNERELLELRAELPLQYVRREDWIRFGNVLEAKMDAMRAELRQEMAEIKQSAAGAG